MMLKKVKVLLLIASLLTIKGWAADDNFRLYYDKEELLVDSLKRAYKLATDPYEKIVVLSELADVENPNIMDFYSQKLLEKTNFLLNEEIDSPHTVFYRRKKALAYNNIGMVAIRKGQFKKSLQFLLKALLIVDEVNDLEIKVAVLDNLGRAYQSQEDYNEALRYHLQARDIILRDPESHRTVSGINLNNIGIVYAALGYNKKALDFYTKSLKDRIEMQDQSGVANSKANIGIVYDHLGDSEKSREYLLDSYKIYKTRNQEDALAYASAILGTMYVKDKNYAKALMYFNEAEILADKFDDMQVKARVFMGKGYLYYAQKDYKRSIAFYESCRALGKKHGFVHYIILCNKRLANVYNKLGNHALSFNLLKKSQLLKDSLYRERISTSMLDLQLRMEYHTKKLADSLAIEKERSLNKVMAEQQVVDDKRHKQIKWGLIIGITALSVLIIALFRTIFKAQKLYADLKMSKENVMVMNETITENSAKLKQNYDEIISSLDYAKRIQQAVLSPEEHVTKHFPPHFIFYRPKELVSGDFYWGFEKQGCLYLAVADCTGHGVPGAFLTMLSIAFLNEINAQDQLFTPADILDQLRAKVLKELNLPNTSSSFVDGLDISLLRLDLSTNELMWSGAYNPLYVLSSSSTIDVNGQNVTADRLKLGGGGQVNLFEIKGDRMPVGYYPSQMPFTNHLVNVVSGDILYLFTDGYADQFGGIKKKKFMKKRLKSAFLSIATLPMDKQKEELMAILAKWQGDIDQVDDICVVGVQIK